MASFVILPRAPAPGATSVVKLLNYWNIGDFIKDGDLYFFSVDFYSITEVLLSFVLF
jgi:hypothetical protein